MFLHLDCRYYLGDRPCKFKRMCEGCPHYDPMGPRILIVKLGALGDVVRTAALLPGLERLCGEPPHVTWITAPGAIELVERMPGVDRVMAFDGTSINILNAERFSYVICLDKEPGPCSLAMSVNAEVRLGVGLSRYGTPMPLTDDAEYFFHLGLDDDEKFHRNKKTYPHLIYEAIGIDYEGEKYKIEPTEEEIAVARAKLTEWGVPADGCLIGINPGAGGVFANKAWREDGYRSVIDEVLKRRDDVAFLLLGGPEEEELLRRMVGAFADRPVFHAGTGNSLGEFTAIIDACDLVVCGDTLAMHLAIARSRRVIAIFGPTCEQEIDVFGLGEKIKTPIGCSPCYRHECDITPTCQDLVSDAQVLEATLRQLSELDESRAKVIDASQ